MSTVIRDGKKDRRMEKTQDRNAFDKAMNSLYSGVQFLGEMSLHYATRLPGFNIRRLAHWVSTRKKKISRDCISWLNKTFGSLGGLDVHQHFA